MEDYMILYYLKEVYYCKGIIKILAILLNWFLKLIAVIYPQMKIRYPMTCNHEIMCIGKDII